MPKHFTKNRTKRWVVREGGDSPAPSACREIARTLRIHPILARLLCLRGYDDPQKAADFLALRSESLCDPMLLLDIDRAVDRIRLAIDRGEQIVVYGDYDVDGVTSVCTLCLYLSSRGAHVSYYIPNRLVDGYGVNSDAVNRLADDGATLLITVDTGITATAEVALAKERGVDFVITDHHECHTELPDACAVVNPHRPGDPFPFKDLAGVGVVFQLICALEHALTGEDMRSCVRNMGAQYDDLVAIGTIADVMPVRGENRLIIKHGLSLIDHTERVGIAALLDAVSSPQDGNAHPKKKQKITSGFIGYTIAPRINAAGRIRSAGIAAELFLTQDPQRAREIANHLCEINKERQAEENEITEEAYAKIRREHDFENDPVIILDSDHWHHGVIGIVSSRVTEHYGLPSILISFEGQDNQGGPDDVGKGSGRSVRGLNLVEALVSASDHLVKFGGHELAAGLSVRRSELPAFKRAVNAYARQVLTEEDLIPTLEADAVLQPEDVTMELAESLQLLEPFGVANPVPVFVMRDVEVRECRSLSAGKHTRLTVGKERIYLPVMCFSCPLPKLDLYVGDRVDLMFTLDINEYNGRRSAQLIARDVRLTEAACDAYEKQRARFAEIWGGAPYSEADVLPTRDDFAAVYTSVRRGVRAGTDEYTHRALLSRLEAGGYAGIGYVKLKIIIRVLQELNLLGIEEVDEERYRFRCQYADQKTDLEKSGVLRRLRAQYKPA